MNFIDYIIKKTDRYNNYGFSGLTEKEREMLLTLQVLNYRARYVKEFSDKYPDRPLDIDTELEEYFFDRIIKNTNKDKIDYLNVKCENCGKTFHDKFGLVFIHGHAHRLCESCRKIKDKGE